MNIYKVKPILCFWKKNVRTGCKRQGQRMGRGGVGWQHACAMQTNMVPLNFFSIVALMARGRSFPIVPVNCSGCCDPVHDTRSIRKSPPLYPQSCSHWHCKLNLAAHKNRGAFLARRSAWSSVASNPGTGRGSKHSRQRILDFRRTSLATESLLCWCTCSAGQYDSQQQLKSLAENTCSADGRLSSCLALLRACCVSALQQIGVSRISEMWEGLTLRGVGDGSRRSWTICAKHAVKLSVTRTLPNAHAVLTYLMISLKWDDIFVHTHTFETTGDDVGDWSPPVSLCPLWVRVQQVNTGQ